MLGLLMLMHHPIAVSRSVADVVVAAEEEKKNADKLKFPFICTWLLIFYIRPKLNQENHHNGVVSM